MKLRVARKHRPRRVTCSGCGNRYHAPALLCFVCMMVIPGQKQAAQAVRRPLHEAVITNVGEHWAVSSVRGGFVMFRAQAMCLETGALAVRSFAETEADAAVRAVAGLGEYACHADHALS